MKMGKAKIYVDGELIGIAHNVTYEQNKIGFTNITQIIKDIGTIDAVDTEEADLEKETEK